MSNSTCKPQLHWLDTKEIEPGYFEPKLDEVLRVPGQTGYIGRGIQIVRGNILRGRPKNPDSLNIRYLDDMGTEKLPVNDTLHGGPSAVCADGWGEKFWKGPIIAYLKVGNEFDAKEMTDMTLTAYRDAIDYLAYFLETEGSMIDWPGSSGTLSKRVMEDRSGKVKGVRINCRGDCAGDPQREFLAVDVPRAHPLFMLEGDDPLDIPGNFGESWAVYRYKGYKDASADDAQNKHGRSLQLALSEEIAEDTSRWSESRWGEIPHWRLPDTTGSLLVVNRTKKDLDVRKVKAVCKLVEERVMPLLAQERELGRDAVLDELTPEVLKFM